MNASFPDTSPPKGERRRIRPTTAEFVKAEQMAGMEIDRLRNSLDVANTARTMMFLAGMIAGAIATVVGALVIRTIF